MIRSFGVERFLEACAPATMLLANEREAEELTGRRGVAAVDELSRRFHVVCVKQGDEGALMSWEGLVIRNATDAVVEKDPTGAGDAFNGVLLASLAAGRSPGRRAGLGVPSGRSRRRELRDLARTPTVGRGRGDLGEAAALSVVRPSSEVAAALAAGDGVVALETSVVSQGLPPPRNLECVERMSAAIRSAGAVPAWIGVIEGDVVVGLSADELRVFAEPGGATKVARRDLPVAIASGGLGATTVSSTIWAAHRAGIVVGATGGIGGVHPGRAGGDVSADLIELARTPVLLVCSGPKSIVDPVATAERLEELGVGVVGYACWRLPFFLAREAPVDLDDRVDEPAEAARIARALGELDAAAAVLLCNPVPERFAMDAGVVEDAVRACERIAEREGVRGKAVTPFLLSCLSERTDGESLEANLALLESNARLAGEVAAAR